MLHMSFVQTPKTDLLPCFLLPLLVFFHGYGNLKFHSLLMGTMEIVI